MGSIERDMFRYIDALVEQSFKEAAEILQEHIKRCDENTSLILQGFIDAAKTLEAFEKENFDELELLWNSYENSKKYLTPKSRYYSIFLEMSLVVEDIKDNMENFL